MQVDTVACEQNEKLFLNFRFLQAAIHDGMCRIPLVSSRCSSFARWRFINSHERGRLMQALSRNPLATCLRSLQATGKRSARPATDHGAGEGLSTFDAGSVGTTSKRRTGF
jgi:hypothetical protein